jgi:hypothetical protein
MLLVELGGLRGVVGHERDMLDTGHDVLPHGCFRESTAPGEKAKSLASGPDLADPTALG